MLLVISPTSDSESNDALGLGDERLNFISQDLVGKTPVPRVWGSSVWGSEPAVSRTKAKLKCQPCVIQ